MPGAHSGAHRIRGGAPSRRGSRGGSKLPGLSGAQLRRTGVATAVVSTLGIAMVNTTGIAHSQPSAGYAGYNQASVSGLDSTTTTSTTTTAGTGTDSLSDPAVRDAKPLTPAEEAYQRERADQVNRDTALAELMITMQQRRVSAVQAAAARAAAARWVRPDIGRLTQGFGGVNGHPGIDLGGPYASNIVAAHAGTVIYAGWESGYGNFVQILHAGNVVTCYGHASELLVRVGEQVQTGQVIALEGSTGESTGPHLHFEVRIGGQNGTKIDPLTWLAAHGVTI